MTLSSLRVLQRTCQVATAAVATALLLAGSAAVVHAQIVVGSGGSDNSFPFSSGYVGEYQQIYNASAFSGPVTITGIAFASIGVTPTNYSYTGSLSLGTTSTMPNAVGNDPSFNDATGVTQVFSGTVNPILTGSAHFDLIFAIVPFDYNPADGNLLLEINSASSTASPSFDFNQIADNTTGRIYQSAETGPFTDGSGFGLRTQFTLAAVTVPESGSLALALGACLPLAGVVIARRRRVSVKA